jgi:hypothetical protein
MLTHAAAGGAHSAGTAAGWWTTFACAVAILLVVAGIVIVCIGRPHGRGGEADADWGSGGGGGSRRPDGPRPAGGDPQWWPEFEQQFAAHVELIQQLDAQLAPAGRASPARLRPLAAARGNGLR